MIEGVRLKVCGLRNLVDAELADQVGADYLGFNLHPQSPRHLSVSQYRDMHSRLPEGRKRVAVIVEPDGDALSRAIDAGFDLFQVHFRRETPIEVVRGWSRQVTPARLWLAPKLPPGTAVEAAWLPLAATFLIDTYQASGFGGSGRTGDWPAFGRFREAHRDHTWILAGGLNAENIADAVARSGARVVDVNSGVESAPGVKDPAKLRAFALALRRAGRHRKSTK